MKNFGVFFNEQQYVRLCLRSKPMPILDESKHKFKDMFITQSNIYDEPFLR